MDRGQLCILTEQAVKKKGPWLPKMFTGRDLLQSAAELRMCVCLAVSTCLSPAFVLVSLTPAASGTRKLTASRASVRA